MFTDFFIDRPIFSTVIALVIVIAGLVAMVKLPIAQFPQVTPVQIQVTATYPGANGTLVAQNVGAPIEQQVNGATNMIYMSSTSSSTGNYTLTIYFTIDTDPSLAQVDEQVVITIELENRLLTQSDAILPVTYDGAFITLGNFLFHQTLTRVRTSRKVADTHRPATPERSVPSLPARTQSLY